MIGTLLRFIPSSEDSRIATETISFIGITAGFVF